MESNFYHILLHEVFFVFYNYIYVEKCIVVVGNEH